MTKRLSDSKVSSMLIGMGSPPSNMTTFFAIPGASGKVRLKIEMPEDADFVTICYKTTAWADGDGIATGTLVATLTDNYNLANKWYEVSGLTNGTAYYFKAFPYSWAYNSTIGKNETKCKAGGLLAEYTMDSVSGTTLSDTSGNSKNATLIGSPSFVTGAIGNALQGELVSTKYAQANITNLTTTFTITLSLIYNSYGADTNEDKVIGLGRAGNGSLTDDKGYKLFVVGGSSADEGKLSFGQRSPTSGKNDVITTSQLTPTNKYFVVCKSNGSTSFSLEVDNSVAGSGTPSNPALYDTNCYINNVPSATGALTGNGTDSKIDQVRIWGRVLEDYELTNIYNGGDGC